MNYPTWSLPAPGLLIAAVAVIHVFIAHFAVGGGLFLVLAERKARRDNDQPFLDYVRRHSRFFVLVTLVLGAMTGVGIWFTIGVVHPQATSSLITTFVWAWAIEWVFFVTEITAAMVYYYGWTRLDARTHEQVGWIYAATAWLSLAVINGILSFMLTPGGWLTNGSIAAGLFNPTFWPSLVARTCAAIGLAGLYALVTGARLADPALKERVARYARRWILPMTGFLPLAVLTTVGVAFVYDVPFGEPLGGPGAGPGGVVAALLHGSRSGNPVTIQALRVLLVASALTLLLSLVATTVRRRTFGLGLALSALACACVALGAGEWIREDLRKPYVIGQFMYVNGVRARVRPDAPDSDPFVLAAVRRTGVLGVARWTRLGDATHSVRTPAEDGRAVFDLLCRPCHTVDGFLAIRPLVAGRNPQALERVLENLDTWRGRRMPPFAGSDRERSELAVWLAGLGGAPEAQAPASAGRGYFDEQCSACHGPAADFPIAGRGRTPGEIYDILGRLPQVNGMMPAFGGTDAQRQAVAAYVASLPVQGTSKEGSK
jgi:mono/diheme cytochrome c family protein